jgi:hypothetical protein
MNPAPDSPGGSRGHVPASESALPATVFLAISLPDGTMPGGLAEIQRTVADAARRVTDAGHPVHYINGMYMPGQNRLLCAFVAESDEAVRAAMELVRLPYTRVREIPGSGAALE